MSCSEGACDEALRSDATAVGAGRSAEAGLTLIELMLVFVVAAISMLIALDGFSGWSSREETRSGVYTIQTFLHVAQAEAASRGRACRFVVDIATGRLQVIDLNDPTNGTDDIAVATATLSPVVSFESPVGDPPVTLELQSGSTYRTTFSADGAVSAGLGTVYVRGGGIFSRITVYGAGGTRVERWDGSAWKLGS